MKDDVLNVAEIVERSVISGPGTRFVIWVQGCKIRCKGCWNTEMHSMRQKNLIKIDDLKKKILSTKGIEGITISGGEPLHQSTPLLSLVRDIKKNGLTIMLYTGFEENEINEKEAVELIHHCDIVIMGRYMEKYRSINLKWRGSTNQKIIFNNKKYESQFKKELDENQIEVHISNNGEITLLGFPTGEIIRTVFE